MFSFSSFLNRLFPSFLFMITVSLKIQRREGRCTLSVPPSPHSSSVRSTSLFFRAGLDRTVPCTWRRATSFISLISPGENSVDHWVKIQTDPRKAVYLNVVFDSSEEFPSAQRRELCLVDSDLCLANHLLFSDRLRTRLSDLLCSFEGRYTALVTAHKV